MHHGGYVFPVVHHGGVSQGVTVVYTSVGVSQGGRGVHNVDNPPSVLRRTGGKRQETRYREEECTRRERTIHTRFTVGRDRSTIITPTPVSLWG